MANPFKMVELLRSPLMVTVSRFNCTHLVKQFPKRLSIRKSLEN